MESVFVDQTDSAAAVVPELLFNPSKMDPEAKKELCQASFLPDSTV